MVYPTRSKAIRDTASQVEPGTHNQKRLHSALGHRTQGEVHQEHRAVRQAA
ncbi:integrase [Actinomyces israelii]|uniref:Integrase n=1 Tax=Actinomyces israelii TaxID=1659 RepID=A0ABT4I8T9_9ACTO|nr:integrase [Actinomyces israelii]MCZ0857667.1 integrase [Actinomyces israelii]